MKRAVLLTLIVGICVIGFLSTKGVLPFTVVSGSALEPALQNLFQGGVTTALLIVGVLLFAVLMYSREIMRSFGGLLRTAVNPIVEESHRVDLLLSQRFEVTEKALHDFSGAMQIYAQHLASHTSAIQGLSDASQALKGSAAEQNRILGHLSKSIIRDRINREISVMERLVGEFEKKTTLALRAKDELENGTSEYVIEEIRVKKEIESPPGCAVNPKALVAKPHF